jgi:hypothetical protein
MSRPDDQFKRFRNFSAGELHLHLASFNMRRFAPALPGDNWLEDINTFVEDVKLEAYFLSESEPTSTPSPRRRQRTLTPF